MPKKGTTTKTPRPVKEPPATTAPGKPSDLIDTRVIYCGDKLEQLAELPDRGSI